MKKPGSWRFPIWFPIDITSYVSSYSFFWCGGLPMRWNSESFPATCWWWLSPRSHEFPQGVCHFLQLSNRDRHFVFRPCDGWKIGGHETQCLWKFDFIIFICLTLLNFIFEYLCNFLYVGDTFWVTGMSISRCRRIPGRLGRSQQYRSGAAPRRPMLEPCADPGLSHQ